MSSFFELTFQLNSQRMLSSRVLEVGSHDVYGTIRSCFGSVGDYVGIDLSPGPGVDLVLSAHELSLDLIRGGLMLLCQVPHWSMTQIGD
jgi:hypothetical protein